LDLIEIKKRLYHACLQQVNESISVLEQSLGSIQNSKKEETKSSVGDKYETTRAMLQGEEERLQQQLGQAIASKNQLVNLNIEKKYEQAELGSLVIIANAKYFLSVGLGKIVLDGENYFCISMGSPIAQQLKFKKVEETFQFNGKTFEIKQIG